jgi:hypothetical protein
MKRPSSLLRCKFGDPYCPCQDGDACHYVDLPGSPAMKAPDRRVVAALRTPLGRKLPSSPRVEK